MSNLVPLQADGEDLRLLFVLDLDTLLLESHLSKFSFFSKSIFRPSLLEVPVAITLVESLYIVVASLLSDWLSLQLEVNESVREAEILLGLDCPTDWNDFNFSKWSTMFSFDFCLFL